jgi:hypothetical protein
MVATVPSPPAGGSGAGASAVLTVPEAVAHSEETGF